MFADLLKNRPKPAVLEVPGQATPDAIKVKAARQREKVADAEAKHAAAALDAADGVPGGDARLAKARRTLDDERAALVDIEVASTGAHVRESAKARAELEAARQANVEQVRAHLDARDATTERLSAAIEVVAQEWRTLIAESSAAMNACVAPWPTGGLTGLVELRFCAERELFRHGADPANAEKNFPGGRAHDFRLANNPQGVPPMAPTIKEASAHILAELNKRVRDA